MSVFKSAVNKPVTTALIFITLAILGIFSLINLSIDLYPKIEANVIIVMSSYPGASAEDVETNLSKLLENTLNAVSDLKHISSTSKENIAVVTMEFNSGIDIDVAANDVRDKLDLVKSELPDGASTPVLFKFGADDLPVLIYTASARESISGLEKIMDGKAVYLKDVARVNDGEEERTREAYTNGERSAMIMVQKQSDANSVNVIRGVKEYMEEILPTLPSDIEFAAVYDTSRNISNSIRSLLETILIAFLAVMFVAYIFPGRWRATKGPVQRSPTSAEALWTNIHRSRNMR